MDVEQVLGNVQKQQPQCGVACPQDSKTRLPCSFTPPRNVTLNQSLWNFLNTTDVTYRIRPLQSLPQQKVTLPKKLFSFGNIFLILPGFYLQMICILYSRFEPLFIYYLFISPLYLLILDGMHTDSQITHESQLVLSIYLVQFLFFNRRHSLKCTPTVFSL